MSDLDMIMDKNLTEMIAMAEAIEAEIEAVKKLKEDKYIQKNLEKLPIALRQYATISDCSVVLKYCEFVLRLPDIFDVEGVKIIVRLEENGKETFTVDYPLSSISELGCMPFTEFLPSLLYAKRKVKELEEERFEMAEKAKQVMLSHEEKESLFDWISRLFS